MKPGVTAKRSVYSGSLILVNRELSCRETPPPHFLTAVNGDSGVLLERRAAALLNMLMQEIGGWKDIVPVSSWRSSEEQQGIWEESMEENGADFTEKYVALPGHSEHQTGLAIDLGLRREELDFIRPSFPYSGICETFRQKAARYGFIERYPAGKEAITGIAQEPWHFRYVGMPHAEIMAKMGLTLEEYHSFVKQFPYGKKPLIYRKGSRHIEVSYLSAELSRYAEVEDGLSVPCTLSGNNSDGYVVTAWLDRTV